MYDQPHAHCRTTERRPGAPPRSDAAAGRAGPGRDGPAVGRRLEPAAHRPVSGLPSGHGPADAQALHDRWGCGPALAPTRAAQGHRPPPAGLWHARSAAGRRADLDGCPVGRRPAGRGDRPQHAADPQVPAAAWGPLAAHRHHPEAQTRSRPGRPGWAGPRQSQKSPEPASSAWRTSTSAASVPVSR
jgi:hypothetical protein